MSDGKLFLRGCDGFRIEAWEIQSNSVDDLINKSIFDNFD